MSERLLILNICPSDVPICSLGKTQMYFSLHLFVGVQNLLL